MREMLIEGTGIFLYIYMHIIFPVTGQSIKGHLSENSANHWLTLWNPKAKQSNNLITCGGHGIAVIYLSAFLNILQKSAEWKDSLLHVWLWNLLNLTQFYSNRSIQIQDCSFLFSLHPFLVLPLMLVVTLICPWEVTEHRAAYEEEFKLKTPSLHQHTHSTANHCILNYNYINPLTVGAKGFVLPPSSWLAVALAQIWVWHMTEWCDSSGS